MSFLHIFEPEMATEILIHSHRSALLKNNNLKFIKRQAKVYFKVADKDFNSWYLHFLKLYWKDVDNVERT